MLRRSDIRYIMANNLPLNAVLLFSLMCVTMSLPMQKRSVGENEDCGRENIVAPYEINRGNETGAHQYPWMVRLEGCGGALISNRHVITAKHCVEGKGQEWVKVSVHDQQLHDEKIQILEAVWPNYEDHDIAIVILAEPVTFTNTIRPICLPSFENQVSVNQSTRHLGWGITGVGSGQSTVLNQADLAVSDDNKGERYFYTGVNRVNGEPVDPCAGESGGPLMTLDPGTGIWTIVGTLRGGGYSCRRNTTEGDGEWNKVTAHLDWIKEIIDPVDQGKHQCPRFTRGQAKAIGGSDKRIGFYNQNDCIEECKKLSSALTATIDFTATETTEGACYCGLGKNTLDDGSTHPESVNYKTCFL